MTSLYIQFFSSFFDCQIVINIPPRIIAPPIRSYEEGVSAIIKKASKAAPTGSPNVAVETTEAGNSFIA